jgi:acyl dehydratase
MIYGIFRHPAMKFADLAPGRSITVGPETVTEEQIVAFAREYDPQWFHADPQRAAAGQWKGLIASGWQTCALAMRMVVKHVLAGSESFGSPGLAYLKWENPVRPGDVLYVTLDVKERRVATSKPTLGIVRWRGRMRNQVAAVVLDLEATSLFDLAPESTELA